MRQELYTPELVAQAHESAREADVAAHVYGRAWLVFQQLRLGLRERRQQSRTLHQRVDLTQHSGSLPAFQSRHTAHCVGAHSPPPPPAFASGHCHHHHHPGRLSARAPPTERRVQCVAHHALVSLEFVGRRQHQSDRLVCHTIGRHAHTAQQRALALGTSGHRFLPSSPSQCRLLNQNNTQ